MERAENYSEKIISKALESNKEITGDAGKELYEKASKYLKDVFESVRLEKTISLNPGIQIINDMIALQYNLRKFAWR